MSLIRGFFAFLITAMVVAFAISNPQPVEVFLSPFYPAFHIPLYLVALGLMATGFICGAVLVWINESPLRRDRRKQKKKVRDLQKEIAELSRQTQDAAPPPADFFPSLPVFKK